MCSGTRRPGGSAPGRADRSPARSPGHRRPGGLSGPLPEGAGRELLARLIRECAANTVKHAGGDRVNIALKRQGDSLEIRAENNGCKPLGPVLPSGGLRSLQEEARALDGELSISVDPAFRLTVRIPWKSEK